MFYRKVIIQLRQWANNSGRKPLIIRGARQVGKTTVVEAFGKEFDVFLSLNLERKEDKEIFETHQSADEALTAIYLLKKQSKRAGRTLLFIDEIQNSPKAVALLRYFYEDLPYMYVIAAGSLLETLIDSHISFPVGRVEYLALRPCSFSEFLGAIGETPIMDALLEADLPAGIHNRTMKLFNEYVLVGGMPEAVALYSKNRDLVALQRVYDSLLHGYRDDSEKYARNSAMRNVLRHILTNGWQYAGERIKFENFANSKYKSREMSEAFQALEKAMVLELSYPTLSLEPPMQPDLRKSPKLLWLDTGLVNYVAGLQRELFGIEDISQLWKGKIAEHIIGQALLANSVSVSAKRNFWLRDSRNSQAEVDFLLQNEGKFLPVEVKSGDSSKLKSLHLFMEESNCVTAIRFWNQSFTENMITLPSGKKYTLLNMPFYYAESLETIINSHS